MSKQKGSSVGSSKSKFFVKSTDENFGCELEQN